MKVSPELRIRQDPGVYPPSEDTFLLLSALEVEPGERFLEVGTGPGLIALHAAAQGAWVVASDSDDRALRLASGNAQANGLPITLVRADVLGPFRGPFDVVAFNPPYLPVEEDEMPDRRWNGGARGGEVVSEFLRGLLAILNPWGRAYVVVSSLSRGSWRDDLRPWAVEVVAQASFPFEELQVLLLRPKTMQGPR